MNEDKARLISVDEAQYLFESTEMGSASGAVQIGQWSYVDREHERTSRWQECYWMVLRHEDGTFWGVPYREGLTEMQEETYPWEEQWLQKPTGFIQMIQLFPHEVSRVNYRPKPTRS